MRKIRLYKNNFVKAIFTNISAYELHKLLNTSTSNIPIIILNKKLIDLTEEDSDSGAAVFTIIGQNKHLKIKNNKHPKVAVKKVNPTIKKSENKINKPSVTYISKIEKSKENTNKVIKKTSQPKISKVKPKQPRYSLQKKSSPGLVALFSATVASVLFSIGLAGVIGHKKTLPNVLIASSLAIIGLGMFANKKTHNKRLVKK